MINKNMYVTNNNMTELFSQLAQEQSEFLMAKKW